MVIIGKKCNFAPSKPNFSNLRRSVEQIFYRSILFLTGIINLVMAGMLLVGSKPYKKYTVYYRTRLLTTLWIASFGVGYMIHGALMWRYTWPTAASALTVGT